MSGGRAGEANQLTAQVVLFGSNEPGGALARSGGWKGATGNVSGVFGRLSKGGRAVAERELSAAMTKLLNVKLCDLIIAGLRRHPALVAAAQATAAQATNAKPESTEVVQLATHRIDSVHRPQVDIVVNGAHVATLRFELTVTFDVQAAVATVRHARLVGLNSGACTVGVTFSCEGHQLASRAVPFDAPVTAHLGEGISLLDDDRPGAAPAQGRAAVPST